MSDTMLLSLIIFLPALGGAFLVLFPRQSGGAMKTWSLLVTIATFLLTLVLFQRFLTLEAVEGADVKGATALAARASATIEGVVADKLVVRLDWIPSFNIQYFLGVDGISMSLVLLTSSLSVLAMLASFPIDKHIRGYCMLYLILETAMLGVFLALDFFLFYVFFEVMLLPMYFLIGVWGGARREYAAIKFFLYTLLGSVLILIAMLAFYFFGGNTFDLLKLQAIGQGKGFDLGGAMTNENFQLLIFWLLFIGFAIKIPAVPVHTWLPDAHVEAPTPISMILAGVLLKIGGYGLLRIAYPICPAGAYWAAYPVALIGVVSIIYGALAAMAQTDFKKLVAYSSVSHMGYVTLGIAVLPVLSAEYYAWGVQGAMFQMIAHGVSSAGMFFMVGVIYERAHHRDLNKFGGLMNIMPVYGGLSVVIFFAAMGLPGLCGFVGEFSTVLAGFRYSHAMGIIAALGVVLTAGYILWAIQRVYLGSNPKYEGTADINTRELVIAIPLVVFSIALGVYPDMLLQWMGPDVMVLVNQLTDYGEHLQKTVTTAGL